MQNDYQLDNETNGDMGQKPIQPLGKNQKIAATVLAVFAIFIFVLWFVQLKSSISQPFVYKEDNSQAATSSEQDSEAALKAKDTDKDDLSDWDELNVYRTSPYLEDSDSDGFTDKQEIDSGKDPNCPAGRDCYSVGIVEGDKSVVNPGESTADTSTLNNLMNQFGGTSNLQPSATGTPANTSGQMDVISGNTSDPKILRQMLLDAGMSKDILDKISDEQLMQSYREIMNAPAQ